MTTIELHILQTRAHRNLQEIRKQVLAPLGLGTSRWLVLGYIAEHPGCRVGDIAGMLGTRSTFITAILRKLEKAGFITTTEHREDRRVRCVRITAKGQDVCDQAIRELDSILRTKAGYAKSDGFEDVLRALAR